MTQVTTVCDLVGCEYGRTHTHPTVIWGWGPHMGHLLGWPSGARVGGVGPPHRPGAGTTGAAPGSTHGYVFDPGVFAPGF